MTPLSTMPVSVETAPASAVVNAASSAVLGEAERPPEPAQLVDGHAGLLGDLERGEDRLLAEDRALELVAGARASAQVPSSASSAAGGRPGRCSSSATLSCTCSTRGMSCSSTRPCSLASETTSVPQPKIRSMTPISKSTPLIRFSGMVRPSLATSPDRLMNRRLVNVYVRGGPARRPAARPTRRSPAPATIHTHDVPDVGGVALAQPAEERGHGQHHAPARAAGNSSALGWVRVVTTTCSPSFRSLLGDGHGPIMSPGRSDVDDVARADRGRRRRRSRPPAGRPRRRRWPGRSAVSPRQVDPDVAAERRAAPRRTPPAAPASAIRRPTRRRTCRSSAPRNASSRSVRSTSRPSRASEVAVGTGSSSAVVETLMPDADHRRRARSASRPARPGCRRPCGRRPARRWATSGRRRPPAAAASRHGEPGQQRQPRPAVAAPRSGAAAPRTVSADRGRASPRCGRAGRGRRSGARRRRPGPPGAPARARSATTALVLGALSRTSTAHEPGSRVRAVAVEGGRGAGASVTGTTLADEPLRRPDA